MTDHVVMFSGGAGSWAAARRVVERHSRDHVLLLTADTRSEHPDWRDFVNAAAEALDCELIVLDGQEDIWQLADRQHMIPNPRAPFCSRVLKQEPLDTWMAANRDQRRTVCHYGFDWTEAHRLARAAARLPDWSHDAPLLWEPLADKAEILAELAASDLPYPTAYTLGLPHNNCLTYGCFMAGQAYWARLLRDLPEVFARTEAREADFRNRHGDYSILRDRRNGTTTPLPLSVLRERIEAQGLLDLGDWGSCACLAA